MRTLRTRAALVAPVALLALGAAACGGSSTKSSSGSGASGSNTGATVAVKQGGDLTYGADQEPTGFNPNTSKDNGTSVANIVEGIYPSAFVIQPDFTVKMNSDLLVSADLTKNDPETVVYKIKPEAKWDDGTDVGADDFIYLWQHDNGSSPDNDVNGTTGYEDIESVTGSDGGKTVTVVFKNKYPDWKSLFSAAGSTPLLEAKVMNTLPGGWNTGLDKLAPFSAGPFKMQSFNSGKDLTLVRNDKFYGKKANLDRIVVRFLTESQTQVSALQNNEVQMIYPQPQLDDVNKVKTIAGVKYDINFGLSFEHIDFNTTVPGLNDVNVRKAMALGLNTTDILNAGVKQFSDKAKTLGNRIWLTGQPQYQDHSGPYEKGDVAGATKMLESAGYAKGADGIYAKGGQRLSFQFSTTAGNKLREDTGVLFQSQMKKIGVDIQIANQPSKVLFPALAKHNFQIALFAWVGNPFPVSSDKSIYVTNGGQNYGLYSNPQVDQLFSQATVEFDATKATALTNQVDQQLWQDMPTMPLYQKPTFIAYYDKYGNIRDNASQQGPFYNSAEWGLK